MFCYLKTPEKRGKIIHTLQCLNSVLHRSKQSCPHIAGDKHSRLWPSIPPHLASPKIKPEFGTNCHIEKWDLWTANAHQLCFLLLRNLHTPLRARVNFLNDCSHLRLKWSQTSGAPRCQTLHEVHYLLHLRAAQKLNYFTMFHLNSSTRYKGQSSAPPFPPMTNTGPCISCFMHQHANFLLQVLLQTSIKILKKLNYICFVMFPN